MVNNNIQNETIVENANSSLVIIVIIIKFEIF